MCLQKERGLKLMNVRMNDRLSDQFGATLHWNVQFRSFLGSWHETTAIKFRPVIFHVFIFN